MVVLCADVWTIVASFVSDIITWWRLHCVCRQLREAKVLCPHLIRRQFVPESVNVGWGYIRHVSCNYYTCFWSHTRCASHRHQGNSAQPSWFDCCDWYFCSVHPDKFGSGRITDSHSSFHVGVNWPVLAVEDTVAQAVASVPLMWGQCIEDQAEIEQLHVKREKWKRERQLTNGEF